MSMVMIKVPKDKTMELKGMIKEGLHIFGRAMSVAEEMCEGAYPEGGYGERGGYYGARDMDYPYGERGMNPGRGMYDGERHYPQYPMMDGYMGERRGRYSRM